MAISIPLIAIVAVIIYLAYRYKGLRVWQVILCLLLGFLIAATTAAPTVNHLISAIVQWLNQTFRAGSYEGK
jgi:hypothetical protein